MDPRQPVVLRLLERYLVEIVEAYDLCPWAKMARLGEEVGVEVLWGAPSSEDFAAAARRLLAVDKTRVAMVIAPELGATISELRRIREHVVNMVPTAGIADFHPDSPIDLASPARLVPYLRRSPDPMLQLVPLAILETVRGGSIVVDLAKQVELLKSNVPEQVDVADRIAAANHARVGIDMAAIATRFAEIAADRSASYERAGIVASPRSA